MSLQVNYHINFHISQQQNVLYLRTNIGNVYLPQKNEDFMCHLILLRHGETAGQSSIRFFGSTDVELSEFGKNQMRLAANVLGQQPYKSIITSPLKRSREGASIICGSDNPAPVIIDDFREINFGEWEGMTREEIKENYPDFYPQWQKSGSIARFPGGESKTEFYGRVKKAALDVFTKVSRDTVD